jgi:hypothetical protein
MMGSERARIWCYSFGCIVGGAADPESVSWLEGHLRNYPGAILIVTYDRYFLDSQLWGGQRGREEEEIDRKNYTACVVDFDADRLDDGAAFGDLRF